MCTYVISASKMKHALASCHSLVHSQTNGDDFYIIRGKHTKEIFCYTERISHFLSTGRDTYFADNAGIVA